MEWGQAMKKGESRSGGRTSEKKRHPHPPQEVRQQSQQFSERMVNFHPVPDSSGFRRVSQILFKQNTNLLKEYW